MYLIDKKNKKKSIDVWPELHGYSIQINKNQVVIVKEDLIEKLILSKFMPEFEMLIAKILLFLDDGNPEDGNILLFDELSRFYVAIETKYLKYLSQKELSKFNRKVRLLANELKHYTYTKKNVISSSRRK